MPTEFKPLLHLSVVSAFPPIQRPASPSEMAYELAQQLCHIEAVDWDDLTINLTDLRAEVLIRSFFWTFFACLPDRRKIQGIHWRVAHDFQSIARWAAEWAAPY